MTVLSISFTYICMDGLTVFLQCFFNIHSKQSSISDIWYDLLGNSNYSFHVGTIILNFCSYITFLYFSMYSTCWYLIKQHIYHFSLSLFFSVRFSNSQWVSDVLLFLEFINLVFIFALQFYWIHYIVKYLLSNFFSQYKGYVICIIPFSKFSDVLPPFTCARAISNLWSICLGVNIWSPSPHFVLYLASDKILE